MLSLLLSQLANGLVLGGLYVLIAIGLSIIFGLLGIVNFAHGTFFALGAYFGVSLYGHFGWPAVLLSPILVGLLGMAVERLLIHHLYDKEPLVSLIVTFALALLIEALTRVIWGGLGLPFNAPPFLSGIFLWGPVLVTRYRFAVFTATVVLLILLWAFLQFTPYGRILRAGSRDPEMVGLLGMAVERLLIHHLYDKEPLISLIVTFALALLIEALTRVIWGGLGQPFNAPPFLSGIFLWGPVLITRYRFAVFATTVVLLILLWAFLQFTPYGRILRAGSRDPEMVGLLGIRLPRVLTAVFGLGCAIAAIAGVLAAPLWTVDPTMSEGAIMPAFVIVTIGGLGSFPGAVIAGLAVGEVIAMTIQFAPAASGAIMYVFMALVLLLRPRGLLGERWERFE